MGSRLQRVSDLAGGLGLAKELYTLRFGVVLIREQYY